MSRHNAWSCSGRRCAPDAYFEMRSRTQASLISSPNASRPAGVTGAPSQCTDPASSRTRPKMLPIAVVLPAPLRPRSPGTRPGGTLRLHPSRAHTRPNCSRGRGARASGPPRSIVGGVSGVRRRGAGRATAPLTHRRPVPPRPYRGRCYTRSNVTATTGRSGIGCRSRGRAGLTVQRFECVPPPETRRHRDSGSASSGPPRLGVLLEWLRERGRVLTVSGPTRPGAEARRRDASRDCARAARVRR